MEKIQTASSLDEPGEVNQINTLTHTHTHTVTDEADDILCSFKLIDEDQTN